MKINALFQSVISIGLAWPCLVMADEIVIKDCQGVTRAVEEVEANSSSDVKLHLANSGTNTPAGDTVSLTNQSNNYQIWGRIEAGVATFTKVTAGHWSACSTNTNNLVISKVSVSTSNTAEESSTSWIVPAAIIAGGGGVIIAGASDSDGSSGDSSLSPSAAINTPATENVALNTPAGVSGTHSGTSSDKDSNIGKRPNGPTDLDEEDCATDEEIIPVSPYS